MLAGRYLHANLQVASLDLDDESNIKIAQGLLVEPVEWPLPPAKMEISQSSFPS